MSTCSIALIDIYWLMLGGLPLAKTLCRHLYIYTYIYAAAGGAPAAQDSLPLLIYTYIYRLLLGVLPLGKTLCRHLYIGERELQAR